MREKIDYLLWVPIIYFFIIVPVVLLFWTGGMVITESADHAAVIIFSGMIFWIVFFVVSLPLFLTKLAVVKWVIHEVIAHVSDEGCHGDADKGYYPTYTEKYLLPFPLHQILSRKKLF